MAQRIAAFVGLLLIVAGLIWGLMPFEAGSDRPDALLNRGPSSCSSALTGSDPDEIVGRQPCKREGRTRRGWALGIMAIGFTVGIGGVLVLQPAGAKPVAPTDGVGARSPDGQWWWDGERWLPLPPDQRP